MKKILVMALMIVLSSIAVSASLSIGIQSIYFSPSDSDFKKIYGGGWMYGGDVSFNLNKSLNVWLEGSYYVKTGGLTFTKEETKLNLVPISVGLRYQILLGKISPFIAAGARYFIYREKNVIGEVNSGGLGFVGKTGILLSVRSRFGFDIHIEYSYCKMKPGDLEFNVGGLGIGAELVIIF